MVAPELGSLVRPTSPRPRRCGRRWTPDGSTLVGPARAEEAVCAAEDFVDAARDLVHGGAGAVAGRTLSMRVQRAS